MALQVWQWPADVCSDIWHAMCLCVSATHEIVELSEKNEKMTHRHGWQQISPHTRQEMDH